MNSNFDMWYNLKLFFSNMFSLMMYYGLMILSIVLIGIVSVWLINLYFYLFQELVMKLKFEINTGFVKDGGRGAFWVTLELDDEDVKEWEQKRDAIEPDERLEMFIVQDIRELVNNEIADGKYGLFNY